MNEPIVQKQPARPVRRLLGVLISVIAYAAAIVTVREVARNISLNPRTEDAQVRANVIGISSRLAGPLMPFM